MKVLVTGGAGYIGSHLVDRLLDRGDTVWVLDNLSTGHIRNVRHRMGDDRFHFINGDILDFPLVERIVERVDTVYHLAAAVGVRNVVENPLGGMLTNVRGSENVLAAASRHWKRVLLASTSEVYGKSTNFPFREDDDRVLGSTKVPRWAYATAKAIDEHLALAYAGRGLPVSIVRYFNSYGPRVDLAGYGSVVARFIQQALAGKPLTIHGDGLQTRCFTFVSDTVEGTLRAGTLEAGIGRVFNIGATREVAIEEVARKIVALCSSRSEIVKIPYEEAYGRNFEDTRRRVPCIERAREELEWSPQVELEEGLRRTIEWARTSWGEKSS